MKKRKNHHYKGVCVVTLVSTLLMTSGLHAEEQQPASETFSERTKEFLSDPSRTGSLVGSILAGAAVANPLAPILGSVAGFMIGKSSAFSQKSDNSAARRQAYNNRSLVPEDGTQITSLAGLTSNSPPQATGETLILGAAKGTETGEQSLPAPAEQVVIVKLPEEVRKDNQREQASQIVRTDMSDMDMSDMDMRTDARIALQKQLAYACNNVQLSQPASPSCYYYSR